MNIGRDPVDLAEIEFDHEQMHGTSEQQFEDRLAYEEDKADREHGDET
tara:strand:+ start:1248 stop:1391 length:144 start_codon:yes stop_codon:yes gene_type:complete